jgi:hypothetical protein
VGLHHQLPLDRYLNATPAPGIEANEGSVRLLGSAIPREAFGAAWLFALLTLDRPARALHPDTISNNPSADPRACPSNPSPGQAPSLSTLTLSQATGDVATVGRFVCCRVGDCGVSGRLCCSAQV